MIDFLVVCRLNYALKADKGNKVCLCGQIYDVKSSKKDHFGDVFAKKQANCHSQKPLIVDLNVFSTKSNHLFF